MTEIDNNDLLCFTNNLKLVFIREKLKKTTFKYKFSIIYYICFFREKTLHDLQLARDACLVP